MKKIDDHLLSEVLTLLAELIVGKPRQHFVVCGGSSLLALGLVNRTTTRDVDVLARIEDGVLITAKPLPDWLTAAVDEVGEEYGLMKNWFNTGPSDDSFFRFGFPAGMESRVITRTYGDSFKISFISRYDQIFFKLYATVDTGPGRHYQDLLDLKPTAKELLAAAQWCRSHDPSEGFLMMLKEVLKNLGHESLVERL